MKIILRDARTGRFCKPHKQKVIVPYLRGSDMQMIQIAEASKGYDKEKLWGLQHKYSAPKFTLVKTIKILMMQSLHESLRPYRKELEKYAFVDVDIIYKRETIVKVRKLNIGKDSRRFIRPLYEFDKRGNKIRRKEKAFERIRYKVKTELEYKGYAITSKVRRLNEGDKHTKAVANKLKTVRPIIWIRCYA